MNLFEILLHSYVKTKLSKTRILDLIDVAIFDYLIQNGDRHHYETKNNRVLLLDNGKGFGNPNVDVIDILAPVSKLIDEC